MLSHPSDNAMFDLEGKPEQILRGAMQVFLQHGYAGTSMDRVAAEAGVSKHTIYNHFQGKEGLFIALFERLVLRHFHQEFGCQLPLSEPPEQVLRRLAKIFLARMDDPEYIAFVRLLFAESGRFPELAQLYVREVIQKGHNVVTEYFKARPELNGTNPEIMAQIFFSTLVCHLFTQEVLHGKALLPISEQALVDNLIALMMRQGDRSHNP